MKKEPTEALHFFQQLLTDEKPLGFVGYDQRFVGQVMQFYVYIQCLHPPENKKHGNLKMKGRGDSLDEKWPYSRGHIGKYSIRIVFFLRSPGMIPIDLIPTPNQPS